MSRFGSIDWLCLPDFCAPSIFSALLDPGKGGRFSITPVQPCEISRAYVGNSATLATTFRGASGVARLTDAMAPGDSSELHPEREILRIVEGIEGSVRFEIILDPRPDYARARVRIERRGKRAFTCGTGTEHLLLRSDADLEIIECDKRLRARFTAQAGDRQCFSLAYTDRDPAVIMPVGDAAAERIARTTDWWQDWAARVGYEGPHREAVVRSAITLKLLSFSLSGAVLAAPTTSLPEAIGGSRNWDYRYCWLRDAALTMRALLGLGLLAEAEAFLRWLLHATALTRPDLNIMYDIYGRTDLPEAELSHLAGYRESTPVRIGNDAQGQLQLDVYGGVISAAADYFEAGGILQPDQLKLLSGFGRVVCAKWREPDHGIWEIRGDRRHYTSSKLMCWRALDCLVRLADATSLSLDRDAFMRECDQIRAEIETRGFNERIGSYVAAFDEDWLDASVLLLAGLGYSEAGDQRLRSTVDVIREALGRDGLIYRYEDGRDGMDTREGAFGICSFWVIEALARRGDVAEAEDLFEELLHRANDLCLYSEEVDPDDGEALGNFPQAFTHVGLINAALALWKAQRGAGGE